MKIAVGGIKQETNCFSPIPTPRSSWMELEGTDILTLRGTKKDIGGILDVADREGWDVLPTFYAESTPAAPTNYEAYQDMRERILRPLRKNEVDGVILCFHGAMLAEGVEDPEGDIICAIREIIGDKPLMVTEDLHANNTEKAALHVDALFAFDTNPHIDAYDRAVEVAECMAKTLKGQWHPVTAYCHPPIAFPTINLLTAHGPMFRLFERAREWEKREGMINVSVCGGFPYVDVDYAGFNVVATADGDRALAQAACDDICTMAWQTREEFIKKLPSVSEAMALARTLLEKKPERPVILADVSDNPGGGGSSETTELLRAMIQANIPGSAAALIWDPETVRRALEVGIGNTAEFSIGGKASPDYGAPVVVTARVKTITDGHFRFYGPMGRGDCYDLGIGVRLEVGNVQIAVYTVRHPCNHVEVFTELGIDPTRQRLLLIKSRGHFRADFEPIASHIIEVDAPGAANPDISRYTYKHLRAWPMDPTITKWRA